MNYKYYICNIFYLQAFQSFSVYISNRIAIAVTKTPLDNIPVIPEFYNWPGLLQQLFARQSLTVSQAADLMQGWLTDAIPDVLSGAILAAIQAKGVSAQELVGMASVLQSQSSYPTPHSPLP